jgi:hypothetical protein
MKTLLGPVIYAGELEGVLGPPELTEMVVVRWTSSVKPSLKVKALE